MLIEGEDLRFEINNKIAETETYLEGDTRAMAASELRAYYAVLDILYDLENQSFVGGLEHIKQLLEE